jgi:plasmid replication initiation protein
MVDHGRKPNELIQAGQGLTALQQKALLGMLKRFTFDAAIHNTPEHYNRLSDIEYNIPLSDLVPNYQKHKGGELFQRARDQIEALMSQTIRIDTGEKLRNYNLVSFSEIDKGTSQITAKFNREIIPVIVSMVERGYTEISLQYVRQLKSAYSIRIYELLLKNKNLSHVIKNGYKIGIDDFKFLLGIDKSTYKMVADFKRRVLVQADKEVNSPKTNLRYEYELLRTGRKVTHVRFFNIKIVDQLHSGDEIKSTPLLSSFDSTHPLSHINQSDAAKINAKHSREYIDYYFKRSKQQEREGVIKKSFEGFFFKQLISDPKDFYNRQVKEVTPTKTRASSPTEKSYKEKSDEALVLFLELPHEEQQKLIQIESEGSLFTDETVLKRNAAMNYIKDISNS